MFPFCFHFAPSIALMHPAPCRSGESHRVRQQRGARFARPRALITVTTSLPAPRRLLTSNGASREILPYGDPCGAAPNAPFYVKGFSRRPRLGAFARATHALRDRDVRSHSFAG